jgi:predicted nucleic acid-binding Zn ribbon protein
MIERRRSARRARIRFWLVLLALIAAAVVLSLTIWREVQRLFGL